jgi:transposase
MSEKESATEAVKKILRATRRHCSAEDKIRIGLEGLRGKAALPSDCPRDGIMQNLYCCWSKDFLEAREIRPLAQVSHCAVPATMLAHIPELDGKNDYFAE